MKNFSKEKKNCHLLNLKLSKSKLQFQTFGNISQRINKDLYVIKPSGVNLKKTDWKNYPIVNINENRIINGKLRPSSDTPTHTEIYKMSEEIRGITHAHSKYVTIWAQANKQIPNLGTTHSDYWRGDVLITQILSMHEVKKNYEMNTGLAIKKILKSKKKIRENPGILVANHGGFCWGKDAKESLLNFERLEFIAELAFKSLLISKNIKISNHLKLKHFNRKHGSKAYYGQKIKRN
tara:strand:+ start:1499 stop:2206 length:708 start_codon:yes stop_codon:yes gene_type:complete